MLLSKPVEGKSIKRNELEQTTGKCNFAELGLSGVNDEAKAYHQLGRKLTSVGQFSRGLERVRELTAYFGDEFHHSCAVPLSMLLKCFFELIMSVIVLG